MNQAAQIRAKVLVDHPGATVSARGRNWIRHNLPSGDRNTVYSLWPLHLADETEIDTAWVDAVSPADDPWQKKITAADFSAWFGPGTQEFDAGQLIEYRHPGTGESVNFQIQQLQWTNDLARFRRLPTRRRRLR